MSIEWDFLIYDESIEKFHIFLLADFTEYLGGDPLIEGVSFTNYLVGASSAGLGGSIDFMGEQLPLGKTSNDPFSAGTITAEEYWPYDPQDGLGPIYNTTTGEQIRPFPD